MQPEQQIIGIIARTFSVDASTLHSKSRQGDLKAWDSLGQLRLIMQLEAEFGISFPIDEIPELTSVEAIAASIRTKTGLIQ